MWNLLGHVSGGDALVLRYTATLLAWRDDFEVLSFFLLIQIVNVVIIFNVIEIVTADTAMQTDNMLKILNVKAISTKNGIWQ